MKSGAVVEIWADGYSQTDTHTVFGVLAHASAEEQSALRIAARTPGDPDRVVVELARFTSGDVEKIRGG